MDEWKEWRDCYYVLGDDHQPVAVDVLKWADFQQSAASTLWETPIGENRTVVTKFLGLDNAYVCGESETERLFATVVRIGGGIRHEVFSETWEQAADAHQAAVERESRRVDRRAEPANTQGELPADVGKPSPG